MLVGSLSILALVGGAAATPGHAWVWEPWLTVATGHESDLVLDPDLARETVPGGAFLDITPGLTLGERLGTRSILRLTAHTTLEQYFNTLERRLLSGQVSADLLLRGSGPWQLRLQGGGALFDDSERASVRRLTGGGEAALGYAHPRWRLELLGGVQERRYPDLLAPDDQGLLGTYSEAAWRLGGRGTLAPASGLILQAEASRLGTDARDPWYDSRGWLVQGTAWLRAAPALWLSLGGIWQERDFADRPAAEDHDHYGQLGVGLEHELGPSLSLALRYGFARYVWPDAENQDIHRVALAFTWRPGAGGRGAVLDPPAPRSLPTGQAGPRAGAPILFRVHAPGATRVALVGDFNGWDPAANGLRPAGDGWWELHLPLPAGSHQYAYWIDGRTVTPSEAAVTVDDGFGGRNGLLRVLPAGR
jgi:hypothetical protein